MENSFEVIDDCTWRCNICDRKFIGSPSQPISRQFLLHLMRDHTVPDWQQYNVVRKQPDAKRIGDKPPNKNA